MDLSLKCWCGNNALKDFSADYARCPRCETLVWKGTRPDLPAAVTSEDDDFYGRDYFLAHQREMGLPDLYARARSDLIDRCPRWLDTLLKYRLPPAHALEVGSSHGAFTALLSWAGFDASGLDLSPWVVDFSKKAFGIRAQSGPLEQQAYPPGGFDLIVLMDVIEHLPAPLATLRACADLLAPAGLLMVQTPCYPEGASLAGLQAESSLFLRMLMPREHLYLFSRTSAVQIAAAAGLPELRFEPPVFTGQDMFFFAGRQPLVETDPLARQDALQSSPSGRLVLGLLDQVGLLDDLSRRLDTVEADRAARLDQINTLTAMVHRLEADLQARKSLSRILLDRLRGPRGKGAGK